MISVRELIGLKTVLNLNILTIMRAVFSYTDERELKIDRTYSFYN